MSTTEKLAIAAHLHVLLRRKTGRVTDTEWMAQNSEYAAEIVRFARAKAADDNLPELAEWAGRLERAVLRPAAGTGHKPLAQAALHALQGRADGAPARESESTESGFGESSLDPSRPPKGPDAPRYVGGIR